MEELFKSLSESVSEECFEEILDMVEEFLSEDVHSAIKKYAPTDRETELHQSAEYYKDMEMEDADESPKKRAELKRYENVTDEIDRRKGLRGSANGTIYRNKKTKDANTDVKGQSRYLSTIGGHAGKDRAYIHNPKYNKYKKLARETLKGHKQTGTRNSDNIIYNRISNPKELYKIGREIYKRQKKS